MTDNYRIALAGNPNAGKSTIFNALTGAHQHVGNWPGKTVEKKEGTCRCNGVEMEVVDLPGTYSLTAYSLEEVIARDFIIDTQPDVVVTVVDASNLERNLYLTLQILELGAPVVVALNMSDMAEGRGLEIDRDKLSRALQSPVIRTVASKGEGIEQIIKAVIKTGEGITTHDLAYTRRQGFVIDYGRDVEKEIASLEEVMDEAQDVRGHFPTRWLAIKLLEQDADILAKLESIDGGSALITAAQNSINHLTEIYGEDVDTIIADHRYGWINGLMREVLKKVGPDRLNISDRIDRVVTNRVLGIPIFLAMMWVVFKFTTDVAGPFLDWVDGVIGGPITNWVVAILGVVGLSGTWVESLFVDGIIAGVGGVLVFVPVLMALYLALAILEDSGYMARAAFVMDRLMHALGLHGKSFLPMIIGFGCTVPALYATRTLENEKDRILTGLLVPFMSCGARLPVYVLFATIFFPQNSGAVIFGLYLLGIVTAVALGMILKNTLFKTKEQSPFVMELPPYRLPTLKGIWIHMWERTGAFVRKAWTIILATSIVIWFLLAIPLGGGTFAEADVGESAFAKVNSAIAPIFSPLGFGDWEASGALVTGFVAKEVVVSTMAQVYEVEEAEEEIEPTTFVEDIVEIGATFVGAAVDTIKSIPLIVGVDLFEAEGEEELTDLMAAVGTSFEASSGGHGALAALAFLIFILIYTPCMVAVAAERQELGTKWMWFSIVGQLLLAWVMAFVVFQGGKLLGLG